MYSYIIVDDLPLIRRLLIKEITSFAGVLQFIGEADNGKDALELVQRKNPDIIFMDMKMPVMDGKTLLKTLQTDYPEKKIIVISGYSDFEYLQEAISARVVNYLLKPFNREEIHDTLKKAILSLEKDKLFKEKMESIETENEQICYDSDLQSLCNTILGVNNKATVPDIRSNRLRKFFQQANSMVLLTLYSSNILNKDICTSYSREYDNCIFVPHLNNEHLVFFIMSFLNIHQPIIKATIEETATALIKKLQENTNNEASIGISNKIRQVAELRQAYDETVSALNERMIGENFTFQYFSKKRNPSNTIKWEKTDNLLLYVESGNTSKVVKLVSDFFNTIYQNPSTRLGTVKSTCQSLMQEIRNILISYLNLVNYNQFSSSFSSNIDNIFDIDSIKRYFLQTLTNISELLKPKNVYSSENLIDNIKTYIDKHYMNDLTLEKISSLFFISPSYFSSLFKEKTGQNFKDYINQLRINNARELLKTTNLKVYKIAKMLGYDNSKYFFRVFKKLTGYTPEEYRMQ